ncbi:MAG: hypothetical protein LBI03_10065, partial [Clostridiales bacterium]|nr:hypothetical protein [Clostridiales bacterium]
KRPRFVFNKYLDQFADILVEEGYLDEENAKLMKNLLSRNPIQSDQYIQWREDKFSLLTFFYFVNKLDYFDKNLCPINPYSIRIEEEDVEISSLLINYFKTSDSTKLNAQINSKNMRLINNAIRELYFKFLKEKDIRSDKRYIPYKETVLYCFEKGISFTPEYQKSTSKTRGKIDTDIVDIVKRVWDKNKKQFNMKQHK